MVSYSQHTDDLGQVYNFMLILPYMLPVKGAGNEGVTAPEGSEVGENPYTLLAYK